jgi:hypothetical protein
MELLQDVAPTMKNLERHLATVLCADVKDYSRHMGSHEEVTIRHMNECRARCRYPTVALLRISGIDARQPDDSGITSSVVPALVVPVV